MKDQILGEISRLAGLNGGRAPSVRQFRRETGIADGEWYGRIWAKWSDAIAEAGFAPNEFHLGGYEQEELLARYAEACLHYNKVPSNAEVELYRKGRNEFPSVKAFSRAFEGKNGLLSALRLWAEENDETQLLTILPLVPAEPPRGSQKASDLAEGWVYLLRSGPHFKVGRSDELEKRIKQISVSLPEKVELVHAIKTDDPPGIEAYWHRRFADKRANGEWFALSSADIRAFKRRRFQ